MAKNDDSDESREPNRHQNAPLRPSEVASDVPLTVLIQLSKSNTSGPRQEGGSLQHHD